MSKPDIDLDAMLESALEEFDFSSGTTNPPTNEKKEAKLQETDKINNTPEVVSTSTTQANPNTPDLEHVEKFHKLFGELSQMLAADPALEKYFTESLLNAEGETPLQLPKSIRTSQPSTTPIMNNTKSTTTTTTTSTAATTTTTATPTPGIASTQPPLNTPNGNDVIQKQAAITLQKLSEGFSQINPNVGVEGDSTEMSEENVSKMMTDIDSMMAGNPEMASAMEEMMKAFMSKDVVYEPIKTMHARYPMWLEQNKSKITNDQYQMYIKQIDIMGQICQIYEKQPENVQEIMRLMKNMQECGQPPVELLKEIVPDMEFTPEGLPNLPNFNPEQECTIL